MSSNAPGARAFLCFVWLMGCLAFLATLFLPPVKGEHFTLLPVSVAVALAAIAGTRKVYLLRSQQQPEQSRYVTLGFLITFGTLLALGIRAGVLAGIVSSLIADLYPRRNVLHHLLFNVASIVMTAWCSGHVFAWLNDGVGVIQSRSLPAILAAITTYFVLNAGALAIIIALISQQPVRTVWSHNFAWAFPLHLTGAAVAALAIMFANDSRILLLVPVVPFAFQYYKLYADHASQTQQLIDTLESGKEEMAELYLSTVKSLATAIAAKDQYTYSHIHRVQRYAVAIAEVMGVAGAEMEAIRTGAVLHDIGKLGVPDYVLLKPGRLTPDEFEKMKRHPVVGADILDPVQFPWPVVDVVRHHHERWDGAGYPDKLAGEAIPLSARILSVADVYDALTSDRPYRAAWSCQKTQEFLQSQAGKQFDPRVVSAFLEVVDQVDITLQELESVTASAEAMTGQPSAEGVALGASLQIRRSASELWVFYEIGQALNSPAPMQQRLTLLGQKLTAIMPGTTCAFLLYETPESALANSPLWKGLELPLEWDVTLSGQAAVKAYTADQSVEGSEQSENSALPSRLRVYAAAGQNADVLLANHVLDANEASSVAARDRRSYRGAYTVENLTWSVSAGEMRPVRSVMVVPLLHGEDVLGAMTFYHRDADAFSGDDEHLLTMIAEQVQSALYQEREYVRTYSDANTDALTGLNNMRCLRQKIEETPSAQQDAGYAVLYLDLDNFKNVNTRYGHPLGSRVLREVAQLLPRELRPTDMAVRYGGDEFVIVLPQTEEAGAREVGARIRAAVQNYRPAFLSNFDASCNLDVSIGIACAPGDGEGLEELVAIADHRMYETKTRQKPSDSRPATEVRCLFATPLCLDTAVAARILEKLPELSTH